MPHVAPQPRRIDQPEHHPGRGPGRPLATYRLREKRHAAGPHIAYIHQTIAVRQGQALLGLQANIGRFQRRRLAPRGAASISPALVGNA